MIGFAIGYVVGMVMTLALLWLLGGAVSRSAGW